jgi:hypothetical protein
VRADTLGVRFLEPFPARTGPGVKAAAGSTRRNAVVRAHHQQIAIKRSPKATTPASEILAPGGDEPVGDRPLQRNRA